jgi:hypothetical protein
MKNLKKLMFSSAFGGGVVFLLAFLGFKLNTTEITIIFFIGVFIGRMLYAALFLVMIDHRSIVIDESNGIIEFRFQFGISKFYQVTSGFVTNIEFSNPQELAPFIYANAKRADFRRLISIQEMSFIEIADGSKTFQLLNPRLKD